MVFHHHVSPTKEQLEIRKTNAFNSLKDLSSHFVDKTLFNGRISKGTTTLLEILQNPHYNKQVFSCFLVLSNKY